MKNALTSYEEYIRSRGMYLTIVCAKGRTHYLNLTGKDHGSVSPYSGRIKMDRSTQQPASQPQGTWRKSWYALPVILGLLLTPVPYLMTQALPPVCTPEQLLANDPAVVGVICSEPLQPALREVPIPQPKNLH